MERLFDWEIRGEHEQAIKVGHGSFKMHQQGAVVQRCCSEGGGIELAVIDSLRIFDGVEDDGVFRGRLRI